MLKIRDEVDLKELEKFGYEMQEDWWNRPAGVCRGDVFGEYIYSKDVALYTSIEIEIKTRKITEQRNDIFISVEEKYIQDLIQAGLVEKVEDK